MRSRNWIGRGRKLAIHNSLFPVEFLTPEKAEYCYYWSSNAAHFQKQECYAWMANQLAPLQPRRVLDIGCGTGEGLRALLNAFSPTIISLEENAACIQTAEDALLASGFPVNSIFRLQYEEFSDGSHTLYFDQSRIRTRAKVTLLHSELLVEDPALLKFLTSEKPFDAVTIWLIGSYQLRSSCRNLSNLHISSSDEYRLRVQNRVYQLAARVLRPGGWLQVVDRGEVPASDLLRESSFQAHREQAAPTDLEVFDLSYKLYSEPSGKGVSMVASTPTSGRQPDLSQLAMLSILSRKPSG